MTIPETLPYVHGSETSRAAAESMVAASPGIKHRIYGLLMGRGSHGATDDEIEVALELTHQTASSRRRNLELAGAVERTTTKRPTRSGRNAFVYVAVPGANLNAKVGRPRKSPADRHSRKVTVYLTPELDADLCMYAADVGLEKGTVLRAAWIDCFGRWVKAPESARPNRTETG